MKIIYNNIIPFSGYKAINLFGILFVRKNAVLTERNIRHEAIHTKQMQEMLYVFFYFWYLMEWLFKFLVYWNFRITYKHISFEQEAYKYQTEESYLENRKHYSWTKYLAQ